MNYLKLIKKAKQLRIDTFNAFKYEVEKSIEGEVLDKLGLHKYCCRRMFLTNVHLISYI